MKRILVTMLGIGSAALLMASVLYAEPADRPGPGAGKPEQKMEQGGPQLRSDSKQDRKHRPKHRKDKNKAKHHKKPVNDPQRPAL